LELTLLNIQRLSGTVLHAGVILTDHYWLTDRTDHGQYSSVKHTCSNPPSNSVVSVALLIGRTRSRFPQNAANISTNDVLPTPGPPTYNEPVSSAPW